MIPRYDVPYRLAALLLVSVVTASAQKAPPAKPFERFDGCVLTPDEWTDGDSFPVTLPNTHGCSPFVISSSRPGALIWFCCSTRSVGPRPDIPALRIPMLLLGFSCAENRYPVFDLAPRWLCLHRFRMKLTFLSILIGAIAFFQPATTRGDEVSHLKAAESLLRLMGMETLLSQSVDQMLAMQVQQNPALAPYQAQMKAFLSKYMSWASMKDDIAKLYTTEFSESELNELNKFYQTPLGKKTVQKMPALMAKGANLAQKRVQDHLPELQAELAAAGADKKVP